MKVTCTTNNNTVIMVLPIVPIDGLNIDYGESPNENKESVKYGKIKVLGSEPLASVTITSFFPVHEYPFIESGASSDGRAYVNWFRNQRKNRKPIRIIITDENGRSILNRLMALETFQVTSRDQAGDYYYTMTFEQYRMVK